MLDRMHFRRITDHAGRVIPDHCLGLDAVPQRAADVDEFLHPVIPRFMIHDLVEPIIVEIRSAR
jgi:hypothetical protein